MYSVCESIFPGFHAYTYEIIGDPYLKNDKFYNPYDSGHYTQLIGNMLEYRGEASTSLDAVSEILVNCKYKKPNYAITSETSDNELSILSLNVQTLTNKISHLRENISYYEKFDALLFNEANCIVDKLPHGYNDIILDNFHNL